MSRNWDGWADDFQTQQERWDAQYKRHADLRAAADAAALARGWRETLRHMGTDGGLHHRTPAQPVCGCGCQQTGADDSADPLDILGRQIDSDPLSQYERGQARADIERRAWELESMRVRFSPRYE